jgi:hypothetical protein
MIYRIRQVKFDENGNVCWENNRRTEYRSRQRSLLGQIIGKKARDGEIQFYRVETAKLERKEILR